MAATHTDEFITQGVLSYSGDNIPTILTSSYMLVVISFLTLLILSMAVYLSEKVDIDQCIKNLNGMQTTLSFAR